MIAHGGLYTPDVDGSLTAEPSPRSSPPRVTQQDCLCRREGAGSVRGELQATPLWIFLGMLQCLCSRRDNEPSEGLRSVSGVGWKGSEGLMTPGVVDIGPLCMLTPPVNILASHIFCNIPSNCGQAATPKRQEFSQRKRP